MDFFLEIHNGECGLGGHFCDTGRTKTRIQDEEINKESALS